MSIHYLSCAKGCTALLSRRRGPSKHVRLFLLLDKDAEAQRGEALGQAEHMAEPRNEISLSDLTSRLLFPWRRVR